LRKPPAALSSFSRWGLWERDVLGRLPDPERLQALIAERRGAVDDDAEEASLVREAIVGELAARGHGDADRAGVRIPSKVMAEIVNTALGERLSTTAVATKLKAMGGAIPELRKAKYTGKRVWTWAGKDHHGGLEDLRDRTPFGDAYR
jgi:hypothetical protein